MSATQAPFSAPIAKDGPDASPIRSILDTDLYKLTMQQAVLRHYPHTRVAYRFTNRAASTMKFTRTAVDRIRGHIEKLVHLKLEKDERAWLEKTCPYLRKDYLDYLEAFRFDPANQVSVDFVATDGEWGDLSLKVQGVWSDVIFYEVPLMAIVSEVYFSTVDTEWSLEGQFEQAQRKATQLTSQGIRYSEFGTRRRRSYQTHRLVLEGLVAGDAASSSSSTSGKLLGTSNVHFAHLFDLVPIGTVAHEWTMAVAALEGYAHSNLTALQLWDAVYSPPDFVPNSPTHDLTIALTDTFSTNVFWADLLDNPAGIEIAKRWRGLRQDSGDSKAFAQKALQAYRSIGVDPSTKVVIYSDGLDVERCLELAQYSKEIGIGAGFGVGTSFTNDFRKREGEEKSKPLNIVIKLDSVEGKPVVKISDELTKNTGDPAEVLAVKRRFGIPTSTHLSRDVVKDITLGGTSEIEVEDA
ncbi:Nicotinate phosphoribosyltransferase family [Kalmanozyma brasiliensis GHG001]|uniref:Nicotinate phosphoribosyltransferase family n=1 Tax=Kalmanozyma brasiliensis (strain GHG001) TaxID=1365824 RepID=UPI001CE7BFFF|nr:Nicotinate phosphoribosyltransferase family [Kalmanozyma brasiliensis GHG001]KAF6766877.1 Nicotinate phosphoribosyltransferase family [Kalmanozyma brasiliensis GHG001]